MMIDATKPLEQRRLLEIELDAVGIRLNTSKPDGNRPSFHYLSPTLDLIFGA